MFLIRSYFVLVLGLLLILALAAGCGGSSSTATTAAATADSAETGATSTPTSTPSAPSFSLNIGDLAPLTGPLAGIVVDPVKGPDVAVDFANQALQAANISVKVTVEHADSQGAAQAAVSAARKLISGGATVLIGPWGSAETIAVNEAVASAQKVPVIAIGSSPDISTLPNRSFLFRTSPADALQSLALVKIVETRLGGVTGKTVSVAGRNDAYGSGVANAFADAWKAGGGNVLGPVLYDPAQASYDSEAAKIVEGNPDAFVIADFPDPYAKVGAALVRTGKFDATKLFVPDGLVTMPTIPEGVPTEALSGAAGTSSIADGPSLQAYKTAWEAAPGSQADGPFSAHTFDGTMVAILAAVAAGSNDPAAIQANIIKVASPPGKQFTVDELGDAFKALLAGEDIDYQGASGTCDMDQTGDIQSAVFAEYKWVGNTSTAQPNRISVP